MLDSEVVENSSEEQEMYSCEKCEKYLTEEQIAPCGTIDPKSGHNIIIVYCSNCYLKMMKNIYGDWFEL